MVKYGQLVIGPAGSGKSTYVSVMQTHLATAHKRRAHIVNLDPAADGEELCYDGECVADIRELIHIDDVMEDSDLKLGPNGGLMYAMEYVCQNLEWLQEHLESFPDCDYFLFDCPGQIELYSHSTVFIRLINYLQALDFRLCLVFLLEAQFTVDLPKFLSGSLAALSALVHFELPFIPVLSKLDMLTPSCQDRIEELVESPFEYLIHNEGLNDEEKISPVDAAFMNNSYFSSNPKLFHLSKKLSRVMDDYSLLRFNLLNNKSEDSLSDLLHIIDTTLQYGEDNEPKMAPEPLSPNEDYDANEMGRYDA